MKLPRVEKGQAITADAWNQVVEHVNGTLDCSITRCKRYRAPETLTMSPVQLKSDWALATVPWCPKRVWKAQAYWIEQSGVNYSNYVDIYAPCPTEEAGPARRYPGWLYVVNIGGEWISMDTGKTSAGAYRLSFTTRPSTGGVNEIVLDIVEDD